MYTLEDHEFQKKDSRFVIKAKYKQATGHVPHESGSGSHDSRPKRQRTRQAQKARFLKEWEE